MLVSDEIVKKIIDNADIVSVISSYIPLEKKGSDYKGVCPFHNDTDPSLSVSPNKKIFKCFSCGTSGNAVTFVQKYKHISFSEALKEVGATMGINVNLGEKAFLSQKLNKYYKLMDEASTFYNFYLKNTAEGKIAIEYLYNRKLNDEIIKRFQIGLSPENGDLLSKTLIQKSYLPTDLAEVGLSKLSNDKTSYYDLFRNRIMFPIKNLDGKIVAFSGRLYKSQKDDNNPKYINTLDTLLFKKGNVLYNYFESMNEIKINDRVFLFEGFMDVIASYRANVINSIATMGTALTINQINAIKKLTNNIVLCYDGDLPGIEATKKAIKALIKAKMMVSVVSLPEGIDPDEYINKFGEDNLRDLLLNKPVSSIDYLYEIEKRKLIIDDNNTVINFKNAIFNYLKDFNEEVLNKMIIDRLALDINVDSNTLQKQLLTITNKIKDNKFTDIELNTRYDKIKLIKNDNGIINNNLTKYINAEKELIKIAYYSKDLCIKIDHYLKDYFVEIENHSIFHALVQYYSKHDVIKQREFEESLGVYVDRFRNIIESNSMIPPKNDQYINLIKIIQKYPLMEKKGLIEKEKNKSAKNIQDLVEIKRQQVEIIKNKE